MNEISNSSFKSPIPGIDPITKGTFTIAWAYMIFDYDDDPDEYEMNKTSRARGEVIITDAEPNPLYKVAKETPLRLQGLVASVTFGAEKRFIRFEKIIDYEIQADKRANEIALTVRFDILDNLEYLENIETYKDNNLL
jgi:hypothetical protein